MATREIATPSAVATATEQALEKLDEQLTCAICMNDYKDPKLLNCFHVFCTKCLHPLVCRGAQGQTVQCPNCRQPTLLPQNGVPGLQGAFHIHHLFDIRSALKKVTGPQESQCEKCHLNKATKFCRQCGQFICQVCTTVHETWDELSLHNVITIQQLTSDATKLVPSKKQAMLCSKHPTKELDLYCETCEEIVCRDCILRVHRDHQYDLVDDAFPKHERLIVTALEPVEQQLATLKEALQGLDARCSQITELQYLLEKEIKDSVQQIHEVLQARERELINGLAHITERKLKSLAAQRDQFELDEMQLMNCRDTVKESLRTGREAEIMAMKKPMLNLVDKITTAFKTKALAPQEKDDMQFSRDQSELTQLCQEFGDIDTPDVNPKKCYNISVGLAVVGETSTATLQVLDHEGKQCQREVENVNCELVSSDGLSRVVGTVKRRGGNEYELSYRPQHRGTHKLHIRVEGRHVSGSPMKVVVHPKDYEATKVVEGFSGAHGIAVDSKGEIYVAECDGNCVSVINAEGKRINSFGKQRSDLGQLQNPIGVAADGKGNILVSDGKNHRIQKMAADGTTFKSVGTRGSGPQQFEWPHGIAVHPNTLRVYVADKDNHRIQVLKEDMTFAGHFGSRGADNGQFSGPYDISFDSDGNVYVTDHYNHRVQVFTKKGEYLRQFGEEGAQDGQLSSPTGIALDAADNVYVTELANKRISLFTKEGIFLKHFKPIDSAPYGIAIDSNGLIYITYDNCIELLS